MNHVILWSSMIFAILVITVFLPRYGIIAQIRTWQEIRQRERIEDALKYLLDREQEGLHASPDSLAGTLGLSTPSTMKLISRLESQRLVEFREAEIHMTAEGERWALHIVRAHRLWERYLADEARLPLEQIHKEAHRREHTLTPAQLSELDAALGHPLLDPHGDPIPNRAGHFPKTESTQLTAWPVDTPGRIAHLEDEPAIAYAQILAEGLRLGQTIRILQISPERYLLSDGETEYRIAPPVAANIFLAPLPERQVCITGVIPLTELNHNQHAEIVAIDEACQGFTRRRFLDLGLTPGAKIYPELHNFFGDPRAYRIRGTLIALRRDQAAQILVKPLC